MVYGDLGHFFARGVTRDALGACPLSAGRAGHGNVALIPGVLTVNYISLQAPRHNLPATGDGSKLIV